MTQQKEACRNTCAWIVKCLDTGKDPPTGFSTHRIWRQDFEMELMWRLSFLPLLAWSGVMGPGFPGLADSRDFMARPWAPCPFLPEKWWQHWQLMLCGLAWPGAWMLQRANGWRERTQSLDWRKGQHATSRTCTDCKRRLEPNCAQEPAKPPAFPKEQCF